MNFSDLDALSDNDVSLATLKKHKLISNRITKVKILNTGICNKLFNINGLHVTDKAKLAIEENGGSVT